MTREEVKEVIQEQLKDADPEVVASAFIDMYLDEKITLEDLKFAIDECGFELDEEFAKASFEDQKKQATPPGKDDDEIDEDLFEDEDEKEPEEDDDRASRSEGYDGEEVYDKKGNPTQTSEGAASKEETDEEKAQKLLDVKF